MSGFQIYAQNAPYVHHTERGRDAEDTLNFQHFFRQGTFFGHARYYFMATDNEGILSDYYANAFGMGIGYETGNFKNFQIGISGYFIYNLGSSDLAAKDPYAKQSSRYEIGLFDIENPNNHSDLDRLEDLYLKYNFKKSNLKFGKQHIKTPFINPQDGRMRPTLVDGLILSLNDIKNTNIEAGYLFSVSPRSTVKWYDIGESIGVYPSGLSPDGTKSTYKGKIRSDYILYLGLSRKIAKTLKIEVWDMLVENVFHNTLLQYTGDIKTGKNQKLLLGAQFIANQAVNNGGNENQSETYMNKDAKSYTFGSRIGYAKENLGQLTFNYNRITSHGRYLMPREWGRDPFFTFMPRERNEGFGDVHAFNMVASKYFEKKRMKADLSYGRFYLPSVSNVNLNKYGLPSYWQLNADVKYIASGFLKGFEFELLYVYKGQLNSDFHQSDYVMNKVDMSLFNLLVNYHF
jgi:hypothetical protein